MRWLELSVEADLEAVEAVSEILGRVAGGGIAVHPTRLLHDPGDELAAREDPTAPYWIVAHVEDGHAAPDTVDAAERALWHLQAFGLRPVGELRVRAVDDAEWTDAWKRHFVPQRIGRVVVAPSWADPPSAEGEVTLVMDPGMAFGTGLHPTTRGCLQLLGELGGLPPRVLDVGCGSGILGLAALRLGAERVVACDTDALAIEATLANAERNGLAARIEVRHGTLAAAAEAPYPLVLANLVAAVLVELAPRLAGHLSPDGVLVAGGIIDVRAREVLDAMHSAGLSAVERHDDGEWVSLLLRATA